jgi:hypothetical protein
MDGNIASPPRKGWRKLRPQKTLIMIEDEPTVDEAALKDAFHETISILRKPANKRNLRELIHLVNATKDVEFFTNLI